MKGHTARSPLKTRTKNKSLLNFVDRFGNEGNLKPRVSFNGKPRFR